MHVLSYSARFEAFALSPSLFLALWTEDLLVAGSALTLRFEGFGRSQLV